jgi:Mn2+/Fe2+ NRAMP family transporter
VEIPKRAPKGFAVLLMIGPGLIWSSEMIGSGEVILTTRAGSILGIGVMWAIILGIFLKYMIGLAGARYTICTGEGMIDMFARIPGPKNWVVWTVLIVQFISATISIGSIATAAGVFISHLLPVSSYLGGWIISIFALIVAWSGGFKILRMIMSFFILIILLGVMYVAGTVFPGFAEFFKGLLIQIPEVPDWAVAQQEINANPWREILPLMGWAAGGFASQVWYSYWVIGAGYGMNTKGIYGKSSDASLLKSIKPEGAQNIKSWFRVIYTDTTFAMILTMTITVGFLVAGAGILRPNELAPQGPEVVSTLSTIFSTSWGKIGGIVFTLAGAAALTGTQLAQLAGWPRLLADSFRICIPKFAEKFEWKQQFRMFLIFFFITNIIIVFTLGLRPVFLVKLGAILDGLLLTPLQALWVALGLYVVMPRLFSKESYQIIKPHWFFAVVLTIAFLVFGYFCIFQMPYIL